MEYLGNITSKPSVRKNGAWNYMQIEYASSEDFNEATSKLMNVLYRYNSDGKCVVTDNKGNKYVLELVHSTFDTINNTIRIFPNTCRTLVDNPENKNPQNQTSQGYKKQEKNKN